MADSKVGHYLIAYDIANPKRLSKVHRILKKQGLPVQYSVFTVVLKRKTLVKLLDDIQFIVKANEDDVRCYRLPAQLVVDSLGRQLFPEGVMLFTEGVSRLVGVPGINELEDLIG